MRTKLSISELKKLVEEVENIENKELYSDEVVFEFPEYTTAGTKGKKEIKVTLLPDEFGVKDATFKIQNIDDNIDIFTKKEKEYELILDTPFDKISNSFTRKLQQNKVTTKHFSVEGITGGKNDGGVAWLFFYPNRYSKKMQQKIKALFKEKFGPYIKK